MQSSTWVTSSPPLCQVLPTERSDGPRGAVPAGLLLSWGKQRAQPRGVPHRPPVPAGLWPASVVRSWHVHQPHRDVGLRYLSGRVSVYLYIEVVKCWPFFVRYPEMDPCDDDYFGCKWNIILKNYSTRLRNFAKIIDLNLMQLFSYHYNKALMNPKNCLNSTKKALVLERSRYDYSSFYPSLIFHTCGCISNFISTALWN